MATVIGREQCDLCLDSSQDNKVLYDDGTAYCFKCSNFTKGDDMEKAPIIKKVSALLESGSIRAIETRGISQKTCEFFNYQIGKFTGYIGKDMVSDEPVHIANYCDEFGTPIAQKIRASKKRMTIKGNGKAMTLYGQWKWQPNKNVFVTIVEGEIDALTVAEVQGTRFPVVSVPTGAASAKKAIQQNLEWLQGFKHVVIGFDNDEAGQAAAKECIDLFEPGGVKLATWSLKDPNDMLLEGRGNEIKDALFNAIEIRPDKIVGPSDLIERILEKPTKGTPWPWAELTEMTLGCRECQLTIIGGAPAVGKTEMIKDIILHMTTVENLPCGMFSFEQDAADTMRRIIGGMLNIPLHLPGTWWDEAVIREKAQELQDKLFVYDNWGGAKVEEIVPKMRYLNKAYGVKLFIVDNLTALAAKMDGDERRGLEKAMELLASLTRELRCSIILVSHLARDKIKGDRDTSWASGRRPVLENFKGSGAIEAWADVVIGLSRNANSDEPTEKRLLKVECLKARLNGAKRGTTFNLYYDAAVGKLKELCI